MGEFIRLRVAIEGWKTGDPVEPREVMRTRANELLAMHGKEWSRPVSKEFEYHGYTINGIPYAHQRYFADFERADGWLRRMSPRLFLGMSCPIDELANRLRHPLMRHVHRIRFYIYDYEVGSAVESKARLIAQAAVLSRCLSVSLSVGTFSDLSDETWAMLAERFKDSGRYEVESYAGDMPSSEFRGRFQPYDPYAIVSTSYRFSDVHPSAVPTWVRQFRKLTEEELTSPECRERRRRAGIIRTRP